ncbi:hypothetical protein [Morganella morganii IS15]|nr:hypothetical protein [Morganella morganii IS15]
MAVSGEAVSFMVSFSLLLRQNLPEYAMASVYNAGRGCVRNKILSRFLYLLF